ncbi:MAG: hypothetical protein U9N44_03410 [Chloroflexota bacterium]|nr:hypothetical protein [Chloroflexota bacterium]
MMWIDNETIITQISNGEIVTLKIDGSVEPVVNIGLKEEGDPEWWTSGLGSGILSASFSTGSMGQVIYNLLYPWSPDQEPGVNSKSFVIDIEGKTYSIYEPEWIDLGNGFEAEQTLEASYRDIRYNEIDIGREWFFELETVTMEGYLAIACYDGPGNPESVKVWRSANEEWTTIDFESPIWLADTAIIGWIVPEDVQ